MPAPLLAPLFFGGLKLAGGALSTALLSGSLGREYSQLQGDDRYLTNYLRATGRAIRDPGKPGQSAFLTSIIGPERPGIPVTSPSYNTGVAPAAPLGPNFVPSLGGSASGGGGGYGSAITASRRALAQRLANYEQMKIASQQAVRDLFLDTQTALQARRDAIAARTPEDVAAAVANFQDAAARIEQDEAAIAASAAAPAEGGQGVYVAPGAAANYANLMEAQAPIEGQYTQRMGDVSAEEAQWAADLAGSQSVGRQADIQRLAMQMAMGDQAQTEQSIAGMRAAGASAGNSVDPLAQFTQDVATAYALRSPEALVAKYPGMSRDQAVQAINNYSVSAREIAALQSDPATAVFTPVA